MADIQLDANLSAKQVDDIVAFLHSLNGEVPKIEKPALPPSGPETRKYIEEVYWFPTSELRVKRLEPLGSGRFLFEFQQPKGKKKAPEK